MKTRLTGIFLALMLALALLSTAALAAEPDEPSAAGAAAGGALSTGAGRSVSLLGSSGGTVVPIDPSLTSPSAETLLMTVFSSTDTAIAQLTGDVTVNGTLSNPSNYSVTLDLNGHTLTVTGGITAAGTMTLKDSAGGGKITGASGYGITVTGTLIMDGGTIDGCVGGVKCDSSNAVFTMNGGKIENCEGTDTSMNTYNVYVNTGAFEMKGGTVGKTAGNKREAVCIESFGEMTIEGSARVQGDLRINKGALTPKGGTVTGKVTNSGDIWEAASSTFTAKDLDNSGEVRSGTYTGTVYNTVVAKIHGGTFSGAVINQNYAHIDGGTFTGSVTNKNNAEIENGTFTGTVVNQDNAQVSGGNFNGAARTGVYQVSFNTRGGTPQPPTRWRANCPLSFYTDVKRTGYILKGWAKDGASTPSYDPHFSITSVTENLELYAVWEACPHTTFDQSGVCDGCGIRAAAKIGEQGYGSVQAAVNAVQNGETIVLQAQRQMGYYSGVRENVTVNRPGISFTIDLHDLTWAAMSGDTAASSIPLTVTAGSVTIADHGAGSSGMINQACMFGAGEEGRQNTYPTESVAILVNGGSAVVKSDVSVMGATFAVQVDSGSATLEKNVLFSNGIKAAAGQQVKSFLPASCAYVSVADNNTETLCSGLTAQLGGTGGFQRFAIREHLTCDYQEGADGDCSRHYPLQRNL